MNRVIYKYGLDFRLAPGTSWIRLPGGARILKFAIQSDEPEIWCETKIGVSHVTRKFCIIGTGQPIPEDAVWVDTCLDGELAWHLYEVS